MAFVRLVSEPKLHVRLARGFTLEAATDATSFTARGPLIHEPLPVGPYRKEFEGANHLLRQGAPLGALRDTVLASAGTSAASFYLIWLQRLSSWGLIEFPVVEKSREHAVIAPQWPSFVPELSAGTPASEVSLDRFACLRRDGGAWLVESPLSGARLRLADLASLEHPLVRRALLGAGMLETKHPRSQPRDAALEQWEFHDLLFHNHHRGGWHRDPAGGLFPFIGRIEPLPARRPPWPGHRIPLPSASPKQDGNPFTSVLERRRSQRSYDESRPITVAALGALLDRAARARSFESIEVRDARSRSCSFEISHRPSPSGGASHELEIYLAVARCDGLKPGFYHYDPADHHLVRVSKPSQDIDHLFVDARVSTGYLADPQIVLAFAARFGRVMWKYRAISYAVILRNAGALYQTLYLVATDLGLSPCGLGSGDSALFARITGLDPVVEGTVGEFILGGPPPPS